MTSVLHRCPPTLPISSPSLLPFLPAWPLSSSGPQAPCILPEFSGGHRVCPRPPGALSHTGLCLQRSLLLLHSEQRKYSVWGKNFTPSGI